MTDRDALIEGVSRLMVPKGCNPNDPVAWSPADANGYVKIEARLWSNYSGDVRKVFQAIEAMGCVVVPKEATMNMIARNKYCGNYAANGYEEMIDASPYNAENNP